MLLKPPHKLPCQQDLTRKYSDYLFACVYLLKIAI